MKILALNKSSSNYKILHKVESGIVLKGSEVKSCIRGQMSLKESFVRFIDNEVFLWNAHVSKYKYSSEKELDEYRKRKLLLHKNQINKFILESKKLGCTIIPLKLYMNDFGKIKLEIALAKGLKKIDKRELIKKRDIARDISTYKKSKSRI